MRTNSTAATYVAETLYNNYIERFKKDIDDITLTSTEAAYENNEAAKNMSFDEYVAEYGYSNGLKPYSFVAYMDKEFVWDYLSEDIEQFMFERGEYEYLAEDTIQWLTSRNRHIATDAIRTALKSDPGPLVNYFVDNNRCMDEDDELRDSATDLIERIEVLTGYKA